MEPDFIKLILVIGLVAVIALVVNTSITDFNLLDPSISSSDYSWNIGALVFYWLGLVMHSRQHVFKNK
jgi:hypothetical protein